MNLRMIINPFLGAGFAIFLAPQASAFHALRGSAPSPSPATGFGGYTAVPTVTPTLSPSSETQTSPPTGGARTLPPTSDPTAVTPIPALTGLRTAAPSAVGEPVPVPTSGPLGWTTDDKIGDDQADDCGELSLSAQAEVEAFLAAVQSLNSTGSGSPNGVCGVAPPSLYGGCGTDCILNRFLQAGAKAIIGNVPYVGSFLSNLLGLFWPSGPNAAVSLLNETIQYIDAKVQAAESQVLMEVISGLYNTILQDIFYLDQLIKDDDSKRLHTLDSILNDCGVLTNQLKSDISADAVSRLAVIGGAGQACIAMWVAKIYHYNETTGSAPPNNETFATYKQELDLMVQTYIDLAGNATQEALTNRMSQIQFNNAQGGHCDLFFEHENIGTVKDSACYAAGGPPSYLHNLVGYGKQCHDAFHEPTAFVQLYQTIVSESFTDNMLSVSRSMIPLWRLQTSANLDAGVEPTPVIRAASSLIESYLGLNISDGFTAPTSEMDAIYSNYNGPVSQGQPSDRITDIRVSQILQSGYNSVAGLVVTQVINGQTRSLQNGITHMCSTSFKDYTLHLGEYERIVAVGAFDCNDPNFMQDGHCESLGAAFKTAIVDKNGRFVSEGQLWNPMGYPESGPWIEAPPLAQATNNTFLPYVISFNGWATAGFLSSKAPVWLYQSLE